ncbi:unnamed protein product, partial [Callosobruchus maculatus]
LLAGKFLRRRQV